MAKKNFQLEHTKPIFEEKSLLTLHHLYIYHTFCEMFKLMKYRIPMPIFKLLNSSPSEVNMLLMIPKITLDLGKNNFVFQASCIWNSLNRKVLNQDLLSNKDGVLIPGSTFGSDITTPLSVIKVKLRGIILETQNLKSLESDEWYPENNYKAHYPV